LAGARNSLHRSCLLLSFQPEKRSHGLDVHFEARGKRGYRLKLVYNKPEADPPKEPAPQPETTPSDLESPNDVHHVHHVHRGNGINDLSGERCGERWEDDELPNVHPSNEGEHWGEHVDGELFGNVHPNVHPVNDSQQRANEHGEHGEHISEPSGQTKKGRALTVTRLVPDQPSQPSHRHQANEINGLDGDGCGDGLLFHDSGTVTAHAPDSAVSYDLRQEMGRIAGISAAGTLAGGIGTLAGLLGIGRGRRERRANGELVSLHPHHAAKLSKINRLKKAIAFKRVSDFREGAKGYQLANRPFAMADHPTSHPEKFPRPSKPFGCDPHLAGQPPSFTRKGLARTRRPAVTPTYRRRADPRVAPGRSQREDAGMWGCPIWPVSKPPTSTRNVYKVLRRR